MVVKDLFFFFQAEDGIRDGHVTGVQTCALPIYDLRWLIDRVRARLERGLPLEGIVALDPATEVQRRAVARLLGRPAGRGASLHVPLAAVDTVVRRGGLAPDLAAAVEALGGPIVDRTATREAAEAAWAAALAPAEQAAG